MSYAVAVFVRLHLSESVCLSVCLSDASGVWLWCCVFCVVCGGEVGAGRRGVVCCLSAFVCKGCGVSVMEWCRCL